MTTDHPRADAALTEPVVLAARLRENTFDDRYGANVRKSSAELIRERHLASALIIAQAARIAELAAAVEMALACTPAVREGVIIYDCGDPWEILSTALNKDNTNAA